MISTPVTASGIDALAQSILQVVDDAVMLWDENGRVLDASKGASEALGLATDEIVGKSAEALFHVNGKPLQLSAIHLCLNENPDGVLLVSSTTARLAAETLELHCSRFEITARAGFLSVLVRPRPVATTVPASKTQHLFALRSAVSDLVIREPDIPTLFEQICRLVVEEAGLRMAWIGLQAAEGFIEPAAKWGYEAGYLAVNRVCVAEGATTPGPIERAFHTGHPVICYDVRTDPNLGDWRQQALARGYHSIAAFPFRGSAGVAGTLTLYAHEANYFGPDEVHVLRELTSHIGLALELREREMRRRHAEEAVHDSETRYRLIAERASDGIFVADENGVCIDVNQVGCVLLGYPCDDIVGRHVSDLFIVSGETDEALHRTSLTPETATILSCHVQHRQGYRLPVEIAASRLPDGRYLFIVRDVSSSHRFEAALRRYASQLEIMRSASLALTENLHLPFVQQTLLDFMIALIPCDIARVHLLGDDQRVQISASHQPGYAIRQNESADILIDSTDHTGVRQVLRGRRSYLVSDTRTVADWSALSLDHPEERSWLGVPLVAGGDVIGLCSLAAQQQDAFLMEHLLIAEAVAAQAATAIRNARLFESTRKRTAELEAIYRLTTILSVSTDLAEMLPDFLQIVHEYFLIDSASVALIEQEGDWLTLAAWTPPQIRPKQCRIALPAGIADRRNATSDSHDDAIRAKLAPLLPGLPPGNSVTWEPLHLQERFYGVLQIGWRERRTLDRDEQRLLAALIDVCVAALARLRFTETLTQEVEMRTLELRKRQQVSEGLRYVLSILNSNRPLEEILDYVIAQACWLLDTDTGAIYHWSGNAEPLRIQAARGLPPHVITQQRLSIDDDIVGRATTTRTPVFVSDLARLQRPHPAGAVPDRVLGDGDVARFRAMLAVPMHTASETFGCLTLYFAEPHDFSEEEISLASMLADHAALAVENARLHAAAEKAAAVAERNRLARELHDAVTQSLFSSSILADVIPKIWQKNPEEGERRLHELAVLNRGALAEMRALLMELRPRALAEVDIDVLLEGLRAAMQNRAQIPIALVAETDCALSADVRVALYRIAQEALNNVVQHSRASQASIKLYCDHQPPATAIHLEVSDDGRGFDMDGIPAGHLGIDIMHERAESIGAAIAIQTRPGAGTTIHVSRPLHYPP